MKFYLNCLFVFSIFSCCTVNQTTTPGNSPASAIGFKTLNNYKLNENIQVTEPVSYKYFINEQEFFNMFHMTKASMNTAIVPDFTNQSVVAIILKPTTKVIELEITAAKLRGEDLKINYSITDTTSWSTFEHVVTAVATIPKSQSIKKVSFFTKEEKVYSIKAEQ